MQEFVLNILNSATTSPNNPRDIFVSLAIWIVSAIGLSLVFTKAGEKKWKAFVPIVESYAKYSVFWKKAYFVLSLVLELVASFMFSFVLVDSGAASLTGEIRNVNYKPLYFWIIIAACILLVACVIIEIILCKKMSAAFGKGVGYALGLFFLYPIFVVLLGASDARYTPVQETTNSIDI